MSLALYESSSLFPREVTVMRWFWMLSVTMILSVLFLGCDSAEESATATANTPGVTPNQNTCLLYTSPSPRD